MRKGIIFDMDGTLWDSAENVANSWNEIIEQPEYNMPPITKEDMYSVMGLTMDKLSAKLFPDMDPALREEMVNKCYPNENTYLRVHGGELYPELEETLRALKERYPLYIVSNCQAGYIEAFLDYYGFGYLFEDIECFGNNDRPKNENIALIVERNHLDDAVYVGDIQGDYDASMAAGVKFIHAAYGFGTIDAEVPAIRTLSELIKVAGEIL